jgi:HEAT repeat protein
MPSPWRVLTVLALAAGTGASHAEEPLAVLAQPGKEQASARLSAIRKVTLSQDPLAVRALAAAYARLEADPQSSFSPLEKIAILQALETHRERAAGPCACKALTDPSREVRRAALSALRQVRDAQAAPVLITLLDQAGSEAPARAHEDLAIAQEASDLLEILANRSLHYAALASPGERQIAVTRWRQWWEANLQMPRSAWQVQGFHDERLTVTLPLEAAGVGPLLEALADARPAWIRENAQELLATIPTPPVPAAGGRIDQPACAALAKGLAHADPGVQRRSASLLHHILSAGGLGDLPSPSDKDFPAAMQAWWTAHGAS